MSELQRFEDTNTSEFLSLKDFYYHVNTSLELLDDNYISIDWNDVSIRNDLTGQLLVNIKSSFLFVAL